MTVLVAAAGDERAAEAHRAQIEGHDVQMVVRVDEQLRTVAIARGRQRVEMRDDFGGFEQDLGDHHACRARIDDGDDPLGERVGRMRGDLRHRNAFVGEAIDLSAQ